MQLIDRYLQAVKFWLPRRQQDDIIAELSEDIRSQIEDQESQLGRKLAEPEVEGILKRLGHPVIVAHRFLPQQQLIGPVLFPIYWFVLKVVLLCWFVPWITTWVSLMSFSPAWRAAHSGGTWLAVLGSFWSSFCVTSFITVGVVTLVFAILERTGAKIRLLEDWEPRKLPAVRDPRQIPRCSSIFELVISIVFIVWWVTALGFQTEFDFSGTKISLAPEWCYFLCGFLLVSLVNVALSGVNLFRPSWTRFRAGVRLASDVVGSGLFCWLCKAAILVEITAPNVPAAKTLEVTNAINTGLARAFPAAVIFCVVIALVDIRRIVRVKPAAAGLPTPSPQASC
jgi:hypothetical protein